MTTPPKREIKRAELEIAFRRIAKPARTKPEVKKTSDTIPGSVSGGFKAGKRRRGNSLLKVTPKQATKALAFDIVDNESGLTVARNIRTVKYSR